MDIFLRHRYYCSFIYLSKGSINVATLILVAVSAMFHLEWCSVENGYSRHCRTDVYGEGLRFHSHAKGVRTAGKGGGATGRVRCLRASGIIKGEARR